MKKIIIAGLLLSAGVTSAQNKEPKYEIENEMVKATYYYDNGNIMQQGFYKDGKLHGQWAAYNEDGSKQSLGRYNNGEKSGKWFFWSQTSLSEVDYSDKRVAEVKTWIKDAVAVTK